MSDMPFIPEDSVLRPTGFDVSIVVPVAAADTTVALGDRELLLRVEEIDADGDLVDDVTIALTRVAALALIAKLSQNLLDNELGCGDPTCRACYPLCDDCEAKIDNAPNN